MLCRADVLHVLHAEIARPRRLARLIVKHKRDDYTRRPYDHKAKAVRFMVCDQVLAALEGE
jgi:hypothetical protein